MKTFLWVMIGSLLWVGSAQADEVHLQREDSEERSLAQLEKQIENGNGSAWVIERRALSFRGQTRLEGIIVAPAGSALKLDFIRKSDSDQQFMLGVKGKPGEPARNLKKWLPDARREHFLGYRLTAGDDRLTATLYVPHGAWLVASLKGAGALIHLTLPWEDKERNPQHPLIGTGKKL